MARSTEMPADNFRRVYTDYLSAGHLSYHQGCKLAKSLIRTNAVHQDLHDVVGETLPDDDFTIRDALLDVDVVATHSKALVGALAAYRDDQIAYPDGTIPEEGDRVVVTFDPGQQTGTGDFRIGTIDSMPATGPEKLTEELTAMLWDSDDIEPDDPTITLDDIEVGQDSVAVEWWEWGDEVDWRVTEGSDKQYRQLGRLERIYRYDEWEGQAGTARPAPASDS